MTDALWYRAVYNGAVARAHAYEALGEVEARDRRRTLLADAVSWARDVTLALLTPVQTTNGFSLDDGFEPGVRAIRVGFREPAVILLSGLTCMADRAGSAGRKRRGAFRFGSGAPDWHRARGIVRSAGDPEDLDHEELVRTLGDRANLTPRGHYNLAGYLALCGYHEDALNELTSATRELGSVAQARTDPSLRALRRYPRFKALTRSSSEMTEPDTSVAALLSISTQLDALAIESQSEQVATALISTAKKVASLARQLRESPKRRSARRQ